MAATRRILSLLAANLPQNFASTVLNRNFHPSASSFSGAYEKYIRRFQTIPEASKLHVEHSEQQVSSSKPESSGVKCVSSSMNDETAVKHAVRSNLKVSERHDLAMVFTCKVCETRSIKTASRESYEKGVVVARCDGCNNLHLIADRLGWFGEPGSIEDLLAQRGEIVKKGSPETLNLTLEDLAGKKLEV